MNIGYRTVSFSAIPADDAIRTIADAGYASVELCLENPDLSPENLSPERVGELVKLLESTGLTLAAVSYHGVHDQLEVRRQRTYQAIERLTDFGASRYIVASRREEPARIPAQWAEAIDLYRELADLCAHHNCTLAVEPQPGLVVRSTEDLVKILRECGHANVAGSLDIAHAALTSDDLSWAVFQLGPQLVHVHIADVRKNEHKHLVPGEGEIDFQAMRDYLDGIHYDGPIVVDIPSTDEDPAALCRRALPAVRQVWAE